MKIIADKNIPFLQGIAEYFGEVTYLSGTEFTNRSIKGADTLIIRTVTQCNEALLKNTNVKLICSATIGYDHIDTHYCDARHIAWHNAPGCNSSSVQQYVLSALISLSSKYNFDLKNKVIGIVGVGNVGKKVAQACHRLGMEVLLNDPPRQEKEKNGNFVSLETIMRQADIITFHTPLIREGMFKTYHLADNRFFSALEKKPFIINSARGGIIQTQAIKEAIRKNLISGTVIDCWENEPDIDKEYLQMVDIATPHIAGYSADGKANATRISLQTIADFYKLDNKPLKLINIPEPENPIIDLSKYSAKEQIQQAVLNTYDLIIDYKRLKEKPEDFKRLRNEYPLRREFPSYRIVNADSKIGETLKQLGFKIF